jgi:hypothetical protein
MSQKIDLFRIGRSYRYRQKMAAIKGSGMYLYFK